MIVVSITAIVLAMVVPSFSDFYNKSRVKRAAEEVYGMVTKARGEAVIRDADMSISADNSGVWCVGYADVACDCNLGLGEAGACVVDVDGTDVLQAISGADFDGVGMTDDFGGGTTFNAVKGTAGTGSVTLSSADNKWKLTIAVSRVGRVRVCAPLDNTMGYEGC